MLALVNLKTGEDHVLDAVEHIEDYAWSPDSKHLAFTSFPYTDQWENRIGWIDPKTAEVHVLARDRQSYVEYYDLEWAPDSRRFIVNRMREYEHDHDQSMYAHDLWLFHISGRACQLTRTPKVPEDFPGWVDGHRISYEVIDEGGRTRFVIMLPR